MSLRVDFCTLIHSYGVGVIATASTGGSAISTSGSGTSTSTGTTTTFTTKFPGFALGQASLGTEVVGGSGSTAGLVTSNTFSQVVAPGKRSASQASSAHTVNFFSNLNCGNVFVSRFYSQRKPVQ